MKKKNKAEKSPYLNTISTIYRYFESDLIVYIFFLFLFSFLKLHFLNFN